MQPEPSTVGTDGTVYIWLFVYVYLAQKPDIYRCICSSRHRLGFDAEIQIIFWTLFSNTFITAFHCLFFIHLINHSFVCSFVCAFIHAVICHFVTIWKPEKNFFRSFRFITAKELNTVMLDLGEILTEDEVNNYTHSTE